MPVSMSHFLMLWSILLLPGGEVGFEPPVVPTPAACRVVSATASLPDPVAIIAASTPVMEWPWRISEADTAEEESDEGDDLGLDPVDPASARPRRDPQTPSAIRRDRGVVRQWSRSPILRC